MEAKIRSVKFRGGKTTRVVHVGQDGYEELVKKAISISHKGGKQIDPAELARFLIFNMPESLEESLVRQMQEDAEQ